MLPNHTDRLVAALRADYQPRAAWGKTNGSQRGAACPTPAAQPAPARPPALPMAMAQWEQDRPAREAREREQREADAHAAQLRQAHELVLQDVTARIASDIEAEVQRRVEAALQPKARAWVDGSTWSLQPETQPPEPRRIDDRQGADVTTSPEPANDPAAAVRADTPAPGEGA